ncbi:hypothetical protein [Pseudomonas sp. FW300-N1A1]|uniref:hypothetical protein n=1 Tax=Pseudomonas sp. FW300-N1A1 TaxID=2075555 RepID=UPI003531E45C
MNRYSSLVKCVIHPRLDASFSSADARADNTVLGACLSTNPLYKDLLECCSFLLDNYRIIGAFIEIKQLFDVSEVIAITTVRIAHVRFATTIQILWSNRVVRTAANALLYIGRVVAGAIEKHPNAQGDLHPLPLFLPLLPGCLTATRFLMFPDLLPGELFSLNTKFSGGVSSFTD